MNALPADSAGQRMRLTLIGLSLWRINSAGEQKSRVVDPLVGEELLDGDDGELRKRGVSGPTTIGVGLAATAGAFDVSSPADVENCGRSCGTVGASFLQEAQRHLAPYGVRPDVSPDGVVPLGERGRVAFRAEPSTRGFDLELGSKGQSVESFLGRDLDGGGHV